MYSNVFIKAFLNPDHDRAKAAIAISPDLLDDENLRPKWAELIGAALDFEESYENVIDYLEKH